LEPRHELRRRADADVALEQRLLEPLPRRIVGRIERSDRELLRQRTPRARERVTQTADEAALRLLRLVRSLAVAEELCPAARHARQPSGSPPGGTASGGRGFCRLEPARHDLRDALR